MRWIKGQFLLLQILFTISVNYCLEMNLTLLSRHLAIGMNPVVHPCNDFFHFACGKFLENGPFYQLNQPSEHLMMIRNFVLDIKDIFEMEDANTRNEKFLMEKQYYDACIDVADHSMIKLMAVYKNILIKRKRVGLRWQDVAEHYASEIGEAFLFHFSLTTKNILQVLRPFNLKLTDVKYDDLPKEKIDNFLLSICDENSNCPDTIFRKQFYEFIHQMHEIVNKRQVRLLTVTIQELQETYDSHCPLFNHNINSQINWLRILQAFAPNNGIFLTPSHTIVIDSIYLKELPIILGRTSGNIIIEYMMFNFEHHNDLWFYFFDRQIESPNDYRAFKCIFTMPMIEGVVNILMNKKEFKAKEHFVRKQFNYIKEKMKEEFQNSWLNDTLKELVIQEIENVNLEIRVTNKIKHQLTLEKKVFSYDFTITSNAMQNYINFKKAQADRMVKLYLENMNLITSNHGRKKRKVTVDAEYIVPENKIMIEPTNLYTPFVYIKAPLAFNFGKIGHLIAHELSHAVCFTKVLPQDSVYFESPSIALNFDKNTKCLFNQYNKQNVDGLITLKENYADNLGIKVAYNAMRYIINNNLMSEKLNTLPDFQVYTSKQLFFLSYANMHCRTSNNNYVHSPEAARVNVPLMNMKEFAEAFYCPEGSPMNPIEKCDFWKNEYTNNQNYISS